MRVGIRTKEAVAITLLTFLVAATTSLVHLAQLGRVVVEEETRQADLIARQVSAQANRALASTPGRDPRRILRQSPELRGLLDATVGISSNLLDVMIADREGVVVAHSERPKEGAMAPRRLALAELLALDPVRRLVTLGPGRRRSTRLRSRSRSTDSRSEPSVSASRPPSFGASWAPPCGKACS